MEAAVATYWRIRVIFFYLINQNFPEKSGTHCIAGRQAGAANHGVGNPAVRQQIFLQLTVGRAQSPFAWHIDTAHYFAIRCADREGRVNPIEQFQPLHAFALHRHAKG